MGYEEERAAEEAFLAKVIARADEGDCYDASGWLAHVDGDKASIHKYGHCSCYNTWDTIGEEWSGTVAELIDMATRAADPQMPDRAMSEKDYGYGLVMEMYRGVLDWKTSRENAEGKA